MKIHEYIKKHVDECVSELNERKLHEEFRPMVAEALAEAGKEAKKEGKKKISVDSLVKKLMKNKTFKKKAMQYLTDEDAYDGWTDSLGDDSYDKLDNMSNGAKRRDVTQRLKDKKINYAPIAYELWPEMSEDAARSWFSKKVDGKNVSFTDEEVAKIYQLLNNKL